MAIDLAPTPTPTELSTTTKRLARAAGLAGLATLVSRVLGLARETVLANYFGAGNAMDAFLVAFRIPNLVRDLFAEGAMSAAFVPTFTRHLTLRGKADAWRLGNNVMNALLVITGVVVLLGCIFAKPIVTLYAGDYAAIPGKLELTIRLTRVMFPFLVLVALAAAVMGMLNSLRHYFRPALAPAAFNVASIVCAIGLTPLMPLVGQPPIMAMAVAALIGGVGQIALQWPALRREGFRYAPVLDPHDQGLRQVLLLMGPGTIGLAATQVNLLVNTLLATAQGTGAVSWLQYAFRLMHLPTGIFGSSIATAVQPAVAQHIALGDKNAVIRTVARGVALMLIVNVPAMVGLWILADPIVRLLLERGLFLPSDTAATAIAVRCYSLGLLGYAAARIGSPVFYALGQSRVPVLLSSVAIAVNLVLSLTFVEMFGFRGLALATSLAATVNGGLSLVLLRRELGGLEAGHLVLTFVKVLLASMVMAIVVEWSMTRADALLPGHGTVMQALRLFPVIGIGIVTLAASATLLRIPEFDALVDNARQRVRELPGR
jgi:putative peptidoglycan lipid II flippase